jgi:hypothetical protein
VRIPFRRSETVLTPHVTTKRHAGRKAPVIASVADETQGRFGSDTAVPATPGAMPDPQTRQRMIAEAAYYRAQQRGFAPGGELQDWLDAEAEFGARAGA